MPKHTQLSMSLILGLSALFSHSRADAMSANPRPAVSAATQAPLTALDPELEKLRARLNEALARVKIRKQTYKDPTSGEPTETPYTKEADLVDEAEALLMIESQRLGKASAVSAERMLSFLDACALTVMIDPADRAAELALLARRHHKEEFRAAFAKLEKERSEELAKALNTLGLEKLHGNGG